MDSAVLTDEAYHDVISEATSDGSSNSDAYKTCQWRTAILDGVMEALNDVNVKLIGVCGWEVADRDNIIEKVWRRAKRDNLFDVILKANVTQKPNSKDSDDDKVVAKRAGRLCERIN